MFVRVTVCLLVHVFDRSRGCVFVRRFVGMILLLCVPLTVFVCVCVRVRRVCVPAHVRSMTIENKHGGRREPLVVYIYVVDVLTWIHSEVMVALSRNNEMCLNNCKHYGFT